MSPRSPKPALRGAQELCSSCANQDGCPLRAIHYAGRTKRAAGPIRDCDEYDTLRDILGPIPLLAELESPC